ncbi:hypothetical protein [Cognatiluteimonas telluris]|jgi:hypothetical protein|uniref:hypothetical protein n=1 Tax=Cognatiluteimonas telluris TaxID=1104775 RepID=UPI00140836AA|nr:hypothetical protein [Lysobacter telluris]
MFAQAFRFDPRRLHAALAPRKPRHPLARLAIGLLGLGVLAVLVFFSVFVGIGMLTVGLVYRLLRQRGKPVFARNPRASRGRIVDGEFRVVGKTALPTA